MPLSTYDKMGKVMVQTSMEFTEREAAKHSLIPWNQYSKMPIEERVRVVAFYNSSTKLKDVVSDLSSR
jgi:hypothetical protein